MRKCGLWSNVKKCFWPPFSYATEVLYALVALNGWPLSPASTLSAVACASATSGLPASSLCQRSG